MNPGGACVGIYAQLPRDLSSGGQRHGCHVDAEINYPVMQTSFVVRRGLWAELPQNDSLKSVERHGSREMLQTYEGGCHCGRVRFRIRVDLEQSTVGECNCSICTKKGILHIGVTPGQFELLSGRDDLPPIASIPASRSIPSAAIAASMPSTFPAPIRRRACGRHGP